MTKDEFLNLIPYGSKNAISRDGLCARSGMSDRKMREMVEQLRHDGALICNRQSGEGYYLIRETDLDEVAAQYHQIRARALSQLHYAKPYRQILKAAGRL